MEGRLIFDPPPGTFGGARTSNQRGDMIIIRNTVGVQSGRDPEHETEQNVNIYAGEPQRYKHSASVLHRKVCSLIPFSWSGPEDYRIVDRIAQ